MNTIRRAMFAVAIVGLSVTGLAACSSDASSAPTTTQLLGPITADISNLQGSTIAATVGRNINFTGDTATYDKWSATTDPTGIVTFSNGYTSGGATFNPGLVAVAPGTTKVTMTNSESKQSVTFTVVVS